MCETFNVGVKLDYIASKDSVIADTISRNTWTEAQKRVSERGWTSGKQDFSLQMAQWEDPLLALNSVHKTLEYLYQKPEAALDSEAHIENLDLGS